MTALAPTLTSDARDFVSSARRDAEHAFRVLRQTGTLAANGTIIAAERIPGENLFVNLASPGPWALDQTIAPVVLTFDGAVVGGNGTPSEGLGFGALFARRPDITTVVHVHSPYLGAWAQSHQPLPIRYVPVQRWTLASELPVYIDRRQSQVDFILDRLRENPHTTAILEANGGATVWGTRGLRAVAEYVQVLEEGAQFQVLAEALGGSKPFGPGVLQQQWTISGLIGAARAQGLVS